MKKNKKIRVAVVAPPFGPIGGPEVVVRHLAEALAKKGRAVSVTLFAPADWKIGVQHVPTLKQSLWNMKNFKQQTEVERRNLIQKSQLQILFHQKNYDIIHLHSQRHAYPVGLLAIKPCVLTFHSKIVPAEFKQIRETKTHTVALSESHKKNLKVDAVISNGIPVKNLSYSLKRGRYLITIGRLLENKGIDLAIKIALRTKKKLLIFGRIGNSPERQKYFNQNIKPYINKQIVYMGEAPQKKLLVYLRNAEALLFPIRATLNVCPLVVMEALACGTPVIGTKIDPLPEPLKDPSVACISYNLNDWVKAASSAEKFDRKKCREFAERYFDSSVMADKYIRLYQKIIR